MPEKKFQRKIIFIKKGMQFKFVAFLMLAVLFGMSFVFYEFINLIESIFSRHPVLLQVFFEEGYSLILIFIVKIVICFALLALVTAIISNKMAGPIYRFELACRRVAAGDYKERVYLRSGDIGKDLEKEFNAMMDHIEPKLQSCKKEEPKND